MTEPHSSGSFRPADSPGRPPGSGLPGAPVTPQAGGGGFPLWAKLLLGCGVVVLVFGIVAFGLAFWGLKRMTRPAPSVAAQQVVSPEAVGWVRVESAADDPGMQEMAQSLVLAIQRVSHRQQRKDLPEWMRGWADLSQAQQGGSNPMLYWFLPHEITLTLEPGLDENGDETIHPEGVFNLGLIARLVAWIGSLDDSGEMREIRGYQVIEGKDHVLALRGGAMWLARDLESWERMVDRVEAAGSLAEEAPGPSEIAVPAGTGSELARLAAGEWDLQLYLDNRRGDFHEALDDLYWELVMGPDPFGETHGDGAGDLGATSDTDETYQDPPDEAPAGPEIAEPYTAEIDPEETSRVAELVFRADVVNAHVLEAELVMEAANERAAQAWSLVLEVQRRRVEDQLVRFDLDRQVDGRRLRATWRLEGVDQWLAERIVELVEKAEAQAREAQAQAQAQESEAPEPPQPSVTPEAPETLEDPQAHAPAP